MKVLIVNNMAPFVWGGAEQLAANLSENLIAAGYESEIMRIPFHWEQAARIPSQMLMVRALELWNVDRVIALKFPAYLIRHPHKTLWLAHQYRQAYDMYDAGLTNLPEGDRGHELRRLIVNADNQCFRECRKVFTISEVVRQRLAKYNGFEGDVLLYPLNDAELFHGGTSQGYIFAGGRVNAMKRQHLLVEAMALAPHSVRLVVAGPPDSPTDAERLVRLVEQLGLQGRVKLDLRFLSRTELATYVNEAAACAYLPYDEDALGYVAIEAATAGKAIITSHDSGGVLGLVRDRETGWVADSEPRSLAAIMAHATAKPSLTREFGNASRQLWSSMDVTWQKTIASLLA